jgi:hypothetical protein
MFSTCGKLGVLGTLKGHGVQRLHDGWLINFFVVN